LKPLNVLIVGCGYLGSRAAERLAADGQRVFAVTRSAERADEFAGRGWTPIVADVMHPVAIAAAPRMDAALYAVGFDRTAGVPKRVVSVDGFTNVLQALSGRCGRVVAISSTSVYGQSDGEFVDESSPTEPAGEGGRICLEAERALWDWRDAQSAEVNVSVLRLAGIYGPGRMLARADSLRAGEPMSGRGDAWLNLIHGDDAAALAITAIKRGGDRAVYLGVDAEPVRRADFYGRLASLLGAPGPTFTGIVEAGGRGSETGINKRCVNPVTRRELGVELAFPTYREGLADAVNRSS
jgi:nucleoside-diphosphate-sugar epimerase